MKAPDPAYFFGVAPGNKAGHNCYAPGYHHVREGDPLTPWTRMARYPIDETMALQACWDRRDGQPEGVARFDRRDGWTLVALWDRSADPRGGCCALFALGRELSDAAALGLAWQLFPEVFRRIEAHLGRSVGVQLAVCPCCRRPMGDGCS